MEWWLAILVIVGSLLILQLTGLPVAFSFLVINLIGVTVLWGGAPGLRQLVLSIFASITNFNLFPLPLFILMGDVLLHSGLAVIMLDAVDKCLGRLPGRLGLMAVLMGVLIAVLSGSAIASASMLSSMLTPEMERRGYKKEMSIGPIIGSGGLAMIIPPSVFAVVVACLAHISVGGLLIAGVVPGLLMAVIKGVYIVGRCYLQPSLAPAYNVAPSPLHEKALVAITHLLPFGFIIFSIMGIIMLGIATPSEAAALGALTTIILTAVYKRFSWRMLKASLTSTLEVTCMIFMIMSGAVAFSQILAFSEATKGFAIFVANLPLSPMAIMAAIQVLLLVLGMFMETSAILMITFPIFMPIINTLGFDPIWFGLMTLINMQIANCTPPFGYLLFVMKSKSPPGTTFSDIYRSGLPFVIGDILVIALVMAFPVIALWLPEIVALK